MKKIVSLFALILSCYFSVAQIAVVGKPLPAWQEGYLDLHHINTGMGSAAFYIFPDGTTMLLDAGERFPSGNRMVKGRHTEIIPDSSRKAYEWIVQYIKQVAPLSNNRSIDYGLITHFHDDHFGAWYPDGPVSASHKFELSGITGVNESLPVQLLFDRGYPEYNYPYDMKKAARPYSNGEPGMEQTLYNYFQFIEQRKQQKLRTEVLKAGTNKQIVLLKNATGYPAFSVQNIKANQWIWTGNDTFTIAHFPPVDTSNRNTIPDENSLSLAITINYGPFRYYTGGDNPGNVFTGDNPLRDVESSIAKAVGEVDIATMDHHGNRDAVNELMVKTFRPSVWIGQTWSADHPGHEVLLRIMNQSIYKGARDVFATNMLEANKLVIGPLIDRSYKSQQGHIVVRVLPGGASYYIIILDDSTAAIPVKAVFGPYASKPKMK